MKRSLAMALGILALYGLGQTASAENPVKHLLDDAPAKAEGAAGDGCANKCGFFVDAEATFFRVHGTELFGTANGSDVFGFEFGPRVTVGYTGSDGLGVRGRWWSYDHSATADDGQVFDVDTYILDLELFKQIELTCSTSLELSAGVRYNDFSLDDGLVGTVYDSQGTGIVIGIGFKHQIWGGAIYASLRHAWLMGDDKQDGVTTAFDSTHTIIEGAIGYEYLHRFSNGSILTLRAGVEMQNWSGYGGDTEDVGFGGFVLGAAWEF